MNFKNLFYLDYWFSQPAIANGTALWVLVGGFLLLIAVGLVLRISVYYKKDKICKTILRRIGAFGMTMGLLGMMWMFFRQERIPFLAWRFWLLTWILMAVWWLIRILEYILKRVPVIKKEKKAGVDKEKYLN